MGQSVAIWATTDISDLQNYLAGLITMQVILQQYFVMTC